MTTPSQNQDTRLLQGRLESQEQRLDDLAHKMEKYDEIIDDLRVIVIALKANSDASQKWVSMMLTIGATVVGAIGGAAASHLVK